MNLNKKTKSILTLIMISIFTYGQNNSLTVGYNNCGINIGNSNTNNGLRLNLWDKEVDYSNGINISAKSFTSVSNGLNIGLVSCRDSIKNGISIAPLGMSGKKINGIAFGGLGAGAEESINGIALGGIAAGATRFNGIGISGLCVSGEIMNGIFISAGGTWTHPQSNSKIRGISLGTIGVICSDFKGLTIGLSNSIKTLKGVSLGLSINEADTAKGIMIGGVNISDELYGIQFGLWNVAENNQLFKQFPLVNFSFSKKKINKN